MGETVIGEGRGETSRAYHRDREEKNRARACGLEEDQQTSHIRLYARQKIHYTLPLQVGTLCGAKFEGKTYGFGFWIFCPRPAPPNVLIPAN